METDENMKEKSGTRVETNAFSEFRTNKTDVLTSNYSMNDVGRALDKDVILKQRELIAIMDKKIQELQLKLKVMVKMLINMKTRMKSRLIMKMKLKRKKMRVLLIIIMIMIMKYMKTIIVIK